MEPTRSDPAGRWDSISRQCSYLGRCLVQVLSASTAASKCASRVRRDYADDQAHNSLAVNDAEVTAKIQSCFCTTVFLSLDKGAHTETTCEIRDAEIKKMGSRRSPGCMRGKLINRIFCSMHYPLAATEQSSRLSEYVLAFLADSIWMRVTGKMLRCEPSAVGRHTEAAVKQNFPAVFKTSLALYPFLGREVKAYSRRQALRWTHCLSSTPHRSETRAASRTCALRAEQARTHCELLGRSECLDATVEATLPGR
ncbi:hypothetical protein B0H16DRAFT_1474215 [Mycena metata]|uniref:Uncharacterized protein n=1 Tax=Mycena metata TaxID=1033252 RepID=A0AAD7HI95_9AGAR|nr:hypothetical protein B0H16DRAFT_1474215 [Mycena metata]